MAGTTYCRWYDKKLADVLDHEWFACYEDGLCCDDCPDLIDKEDVLKEEN